MRLTIEQRLQGLERDTVVLHDTIKLLHKLLKEQGELISDYIVQKITSTNPNGEHNAKNVWPEEELYTFVCKLCKQIYLQAEIRQNQKGYEENP